MSSRFKVISSARWGGETLVCCQHVQLSPSSGPWGASTTAARKRSKRMLHRVVYLLLGYLSASITLVLFLATLAA